MNIPVYCDDIQALCEQLKTKEKPLEWIQYATEIAKVCKSIVELATETVLNNETKQAELNI